MSDLQAAPFIVPKYDGAMSLRDWHILFATQNVAPLMRLRAMRPRSIVMVTLDPTDPKPKVAFRTEHNVMAILPPEEAKSVTPEKIIVVTVDHDGVVVVATRFRIGDENLPPSEE